MPSSANEAQNLTVPDSLKKYLTSRKGSGASRAMTENDLTDDEKVFMQNVVSLSLFSSLLIRSIFV